MHRKAFGVRQITFGQEPKQADKRAEFLGYLEP